jgi:LPXTG-motif cell wall-anchored protein
MLARKPAERIVMKKLALGLISASAAVFGFGLVADAYPPPAVSVSVDDPTPAPNQQLNVTFRGCEPGETVRFVLLSSTDTSPCNGTSSGLSLLLQAAPSGTSIGQVTAPSSAGTYTGTATGQTSGRTGTFTVVVSQATSPPGGLPATGSSGISTSTTVAIGLLVVGAGLFAVSQIRRRQASA